jgi:hypothetical protein
VLILRQNNYNTSYTKDICKAKIDDDKEEELIKQVTSKYSYNLN